MRRSSFVFGAYLCLILGLAVNTRAQDPNEKYLTAADIEKAAGMKGVNLVPRGSVAGAGGDLNFTDSSGELILMVQFTDARNYAGFKAKYAKGAAAAVGDEAILGAIMPGMAENLLAFKKGTHCVVLTAFADFVKQKVYLTVDQLTALGKLIASRL
jgi:hypothetical protein